MKYTLMATLLVAACLGGAAHAELVWKWTGQDGKVQYGNQPPSGVKAEQVDVKTSKVGTFATPDQLRKLSPQAAPGTAVAKSTVGKSAHMRTPGKGEAGPTTVHLRPEDNSTACPAVMKSCVKKGERANSQPAPGAPPIVDKNGVVRD